VADGFYRENSSWPSPPLVPARTYLAGAVMNIYYVAAIWLGMALIAALVSIRIAVPAALVEIVIGALAGNIPGLREHVTQTDVVVFLASVGSLALTFLAGAEIDPVSLRQHWRASLSIGLVSFALPFGAAFGFCGLVLGWSLHAAEIGGIALSTTSVAVVYAVMVETGLNRHDLGKLILAACFVTDLGTVLALGGLFASYGWLLIVFVAVSAVTVILLPRMLRLAIRYFGQRVSEPEIKLLLVVLFGLGGLAGGAGIIGLLLLVKLAAKLAGVWPAAAVFKLPPRDCAYTTLLMATGLTFGSIAALYGLTHHLIGKSQYTELVTVVILSAFVPTLIAQQFFRPVISGTGPDDG
jgi:Kef-type K+ transport system membrane component KefB